MICWTCLETNHLFRRPQNALGEFQTVNLRLSWHFRIMANSPILNFFIGIAATFVGFLLNQTSQQTKERKQKLERIVALLDSTRNELDFYAGKLRQLSSDMTNMRKNSSPVPGVEGIAVPSYDLLPAFLEKAKLQFADFHQTLPLVSKVGNCHYELCHLQGKLTLFKEQASTAQGPQCLPFLVLSAGGLKGLADENAQLFEAVAKELNTWAEKYRKDLDSFLEFACFGPWVKD